MQHDTERAPVTRLDLERWALGRLEPERCATLEALGQQDPELRARMDRVRAEIEAASQDMPTLELPVDTAEEVYGTYWARWLALFRHPAFLGLSGALLAAVVLVVVLPDAPVDGGPDTVVPAETFRGALDLELHRVRLGEAALQGALVQAKEGDRLQYAITSPVAGWLQIYNLQDDGRIQQYLAPRQVEAKQPVESAVVLDDYAGTERIFFLLSSQPVEQDQVQAAAERAFRRPLVELDTLPGLGQGVTQRSVLVVKEPTP